MMDKLDERFYNGFVGEEEIIFSLVKKNGDKEEFGIWNGYFDTIIRKVEPQQNGWTSLAYYFHLDIGWYDESPWLIENVSEAIDQLKSIDISSFDSNEEKEILTIIISMLEKALDNNEEVYILYD